MPVRRCGNTSVSFMWSLTIVSDTHTSSNASPPRRAGSCAEEEDMKYSYCAAHIPALHCVVCKHIPGFAPPYRCRLQCLRADYEVYAFVSLAFWQTCVCRLSELLTFDLLMQIFKYLILKNSLIILAGSQKYHSKKQ